MASKKIRDIVAKTGEYHDNDGNRKGRYTNAGSLFYNEEDKSFFILMNRTFNPAGVPNLSDRGEGDSVFLSCFTPDRKEGSNSHGGQATGGNNKSGGDYGAASGGSSAYGTNAAAASHQRSLDDDIPF